MPSSFWPHRNRGGSRRRCSPWTAAGWTTSGTVRLTLRSCRRRANFALTFRQNALAPAVAGIGWRQFGAEQEDLTGVVDPQQQHDEAAGGSIGRGDGAAADVPADQRFAGDEQKGGDDGAERNIPPFKV